MPSRARWLPILAAVLTAGCRAPEPSLPVAFAPELGAVHGGGPWVETGLRAAVEDARWLRPDAGPQVPTLPLSIEIGELRSAADRPVLRLVAVAEPPGPWQPTLGLELDAVVEVEPAQGELDGRAHADLALERAVAVLDAKVGLALRPKEAIGPILAAEDPQIVALGLDWVVDHRAREHADAVAGLVDHPDDRVSLQAVETLGVVGEARHAGVLVRLPKLADRAYAQRIYDALGRLGGAQARGFLEFAVRNEDDPVMVEVAADALSRLSADPSTVAEPGHTLRGHR